MNQTSVTRRIKAIADSIGIGIITLGGGGEVTYANEAGLKLLGIQLADIIEGRFDDIIHDDSMRRALESVRSGITGLSRFEMKIEDRELSVTVRRTESNQYGVVTLVIENITRFRELEKIKTEFVGTLLHRLRTPLTTLKSSMSFLTRLNSNVSEDVQDVLTMCQSETNRLVLFLNDLRDLFLIESGLVQQTIEMGVTALGPVIDKAVRVVKPEIREKGINLEIQGDANQLVVEGDEERILQVITNILINAVTFTPEGGRVSILTADEQDNVRVSISDTGIGIAEDELEHVFEKYYRADNTITRDVIGYGLGLFIAKYFVESMSGRIYAYSEKSKGSQFDIVFPR